MMSTVGICETRGAVKALKSPLKSIFEIIWRDKNKSESCLGHVCELHSSEPCTKEPAPDPSGHTIRQPCNTVFRCPFVVRYALIERQFWRGYF